MRWMPKANQGEGSIIIMPRMCIHLSQESEGDYARYFTGDGIEHALVCLSCRDNPDSIEGNLCLVSPEQFVQVEEEGYWEWDNSAILGQPEIRQRLTGLSFIHKEVAQIGVVPDEIAALQPIPADTNGECMLLTVDGTLFRVDPLRGSSDRLMNLSGTGTSLTPKYSLHVSPSGDMVAVVEARGRRGVVVDVTVGTATMSLDRGDSHPEQTEFPVAFFENGSRLRLVHGTNWNRLDISDPRTGQLLTDRSPTSYRQGEERPLHYLDYFHGGLAVSPGGEWIVDNGWVWHPLGVVVAWSLRRWAADNLWESEDGSTKRSLCRRNYFWGGPLCWINDNTLAVWGYGNDDENLIPAALLFDITSGRLVRWFPGPVGSFVFDHHLFSFSASGGTSVWDVVTGERLLHDRSFCPTVYHPGVQQFVTVTPDGRLRMSSLVGS